MIFLYALYGLCALCTLLYFYTRSQVQTSDDPQFHHFQRSYLTIYLLAIAGDWLQGPHVYALYESYGMSKHQIELLFIAGFGSSMLFGTFIGGVADKYGRKLNCFIYGVLYGGACITKHFANFHILMLGRLLGGIATSILYSAFESWLVFEHSKRGFGDDLLSTVFSHATLGNSLVAIASGLAAQFAADLFGYVAPFDLSLSVLAVMCVLLVYTWPENYGDQRAHFTHSFVEGWRVLRADRKVLCLGIAQSLFEGGMYTFVLEWTPVLEGAASSVRSTEAGGRLIPHGYVFASFMVSIMIGSSLFKLLTKFARAESFMRVVLLVAAASMAVPLLYPDDVLLLLLAFIVFEVCVGLFWPAMGYMRGLYVPENARATVLNFFRVPLNLIVVVMLSQDLAVDRIFTAIVLFLLLAAVAQHALYSAAAKQGFAHHVANHVDPDDDKEESDDVQVKHIPADVV